MRRISSPTDREVGVRPYAVDVDAAARLWKESEVLVDQTFALG